MRPLGWLSIEAGGWLAGEIWHKSAGLTSQLKLAFYNFFVGPGAIGRCGTKIAKKLTNNTVYCL